MHTRAREAGICQACEERQKTALAHGEGMLRHMLAILLLASFTASQTGASRPLHAVDKTGATSAKRATQAAPPMVATEDADEYAPVTIEQPPFLLWNYAFDARFADFSYEDMWTLNVAQTRFAP